MPVATIKKEKSGNVLVVKAMRDYSDEPVFKKKAKKTAAFIKKHGLPKTLSKKNK